MDLAGEVSAGLVDIGILEKCHTFINVGAFVHDHHGYPFVCSKYDSCVVFLKGSDGIPFHFGYVGMGCTLACVVLEEILGFLVVFTAVYPFGVFPKFIADLFGNCNVLGDGNFCLCN